MTSPAGASPFESLQDAVSQALVVLLNLDSFGTSPTGLADALTAASEAGQSLDKARRAAVEADRESGSATLHLDADDADALRAALYHSAHSPSSALVLTKATRDRVWTLRGRLAKSVSRHAEAASILAEAERTASTPTERACAACGRACDTIFSGVRVHAKCRDALTVRWEDDAA